MLDVLPVTAFEDRASIVAVIAEHDVKRPDVAPDGIERPTSIVASLHAHALAVGHYERELAAWRSNSMNGPAPVSPYLMVTPPERPSVDLTLLSRADTMIATGRIGEVIAPPPAVAAIPPGEALAYLLTLNETIPALPQSFERPRPVVHGGPLNGRPVSGPGLA
ncbi:hypothetical protein HF995_13405 [Sanguibacter hominis ATCC BAA-789]|uniref:Uncharacterized protein n=1 Tax=Sanguibacter hominis ATCC BAA-789 TaxID=1312740 RepID=A0A9X5FLD7_9MICO|nr:hypothetical protein [Sanguibacter hominis]NKX94253.1 hypothetical protein [Sanguibacter hominis ATCC BAA-789]